MSTGKKALNVFGIIIAWFLSIVLVLLLFLAPSFLSAASSIKPKTLLNSAKKIDISQAVSMLMVVEDGEGTMDPQMADLLSTNTVQELYDRYIESVFAVFDKDLPQVALDEAAVRDIVHRNIDELYELTVRYTPEMAAGDEATVKAQLESEIIASFMELVTELPTGEELIQEITSDPTTQLAVSYLIPGNTALKLSYIGSIVTLSILIFVCRLFGWRGFRWLSTDLFIGGGLSALVCADLAVSTPVFVTLFGEIPAAGLIISTLLPVFSQGVYIRTGIMIISAIALLVIYLYIKKAAAKKAASPASESSIAPGLAE